MITIRYIGGISVEAWYAPTSYREKISSTSLFTPTLLVPKGLIITKKIKQTTDIQSQPSKQRNITEPSGTVNKPFYKQ